MLHNLLFTIITRTLKEDKIKTYLEGSSNEVRGHVCTRKGKV
jgi:hypothetical protein